MAAESLKAYFEAFAKHYDPLIDWSFREPFEIQLWRRLLERWSVNTALDCACGSGFHLELLTRLGVRMSGCDFSDAMVERARERTARIADRLDIRRCSWNELAREYAEPFDMVMCVGNSLAYVESKAERARHVEAMLSLVRPGGIFVAECLNYELLIEERTPFLPVYHRESPDGSMVDLGHVMTYREGAVDVHVYIVHERPDGKLLDRMHHVRTYTVLREPFADYLRRAGCAEVRFFSGDIDNLVPFDQARDRRWFCVAVKGP